MSLGAALTRLTALEDLNLKCAARVVEEKWILACTNLIQQGPTHISSSVFLRISHKFDVQIKTFLVTIIFSRESRNSSPELSANLLYACTGYRNNGLGEDGGRSIAGAMAKCTSLQYLELRC